MSDLETDQDFPRNRAEAALMAASAQDVGIAIALDRRGLAFPREAADARIALFGHLRRLSREARQTETRLVGLESLLNWAVEIISEERAAIADRAEQLERRSPSPGIESILHIADDEMELRQQFLETAADVLQNPRSGREA